MEAVARPPDIAWLDDETAAEASGGATDDRWRELFAELANRQVDSLDELYDLAAVDVYRLALWRTGSAEDAEDVVQDVFLRLVEHGPKLAAIRHPKRWLLTVARRRAVDQVRRSGRWPTEPLDETAFLVARTGDPARVVDARRVSRLVGELPAKQREVLLLRHFADCSFADIGRITGVPTFTAASRYRLAVTRLRRRLENRDDDRS
jgi:RNA polymerase sigma-70 factor (ECF subfamily)